MMASSSSSRSVLCELKDLEGNSLGTPIALPHSTRPRDLQRYVNELLHNEERIPYAFYISNNELVEELGNYLQNNQGHTEAVIMVKFSPDGRNFASASGDTAVRLWDLSTQTPWRTCTGHRNWVMCIAWSPDAKFLVSGSKSGEVIIWDPPTGNLLGTLLGHTNWITEISWEPLHLQAPCRRFVSVSKDVVARIWDAVLKRCVMCLSGHTQSVTCVRWGGDGLIYTGSQDGTIKVWDPEQGRLIHDLEGHSGRINSLALSTDHVLRTGAFGHRGTQYDSPEEMKQAALEIYNRVRGNAPERLASCSDDFQIHIWDPLVIRHYRFRLSGHQQLVNHVSFSPDGIWLASASFDNSVRLWNSITGEFVYRFLGHVADAYQLSWSPDGRFLVSGSKDTTVKVWDITAKRLRYDIPGHFDEIHTVDWSPNGEMVASGSKDRTVTMFSYRYPISDSKSLWTDNY